MKVLVACEESQRVCMAFRERGHEAYSCDIQECSGGHPEWHIKEDVLKILNPRIVGCSRGVIFRTEDFERHFIGNWDLIIAHPPCTYLSNAGAIRMFPNKQLNKERYQKALEAKEFFMKFLEADCEKICVENPMPLSIMELPKPSCIIQPYEFGEKYCKRTYLWLRGLPPLLPTILENKYIPYVGARSKNGHTWGVAHSKKDRSKTFPGIAMAMAEQWG